MVNKEGRVLTKEELNKIIKETESKIIGGSSAYIKLISDDRSTSEKTRILDKINDGILDILKSFKFKVADYDTTTKLESLIVYFLEKVKNEEQIWAYEYVIEYNYNTESNDVIYPRTIIHFARSPMVTGLKNNIYWIDFSVDIDKNVSSKITCCT